MLQRLPIALSQVKEGNTSENLLNEIRQRIYYLYQVKQITKKSFLFTFISGRDFYIKSCCICYR